MDEIANPYAPGAGNPPPELAGRAEIVRKLEVALKRCAQGRPAQYPILVGLRGVGKTVLLVKALQIAEVERFVRIDIEAHEGKTLAELLLPGVRKALIEMSILENARDRAQRGLRILKSFLAGVKFSFQGMEFGIDAELGVADSGDLEADLPDLLCALGEAAAGAKRPVLITIDELQYLSGAELSALIMAMHKVSQRSLPIAFIGAGLPQLLGMAGNSKSYAERLFVYLTIGALSDEDAIQAIEHPARLSKAQFERAATLKIMQVTGCYPYFLQQWAHDAWNHATGATIHEADVDAATGRSIRTLDQSFFKVRFDRCTPSEKKYMRALASLGPGHHRSSDVAEALGVKVTSVAPTRNTLIRKGMIYSPSYGDMTFTVPMFDEFMRRAMPEFKATMG